MPNKGMEDIMATRRKQAQLEEQNRGQKAKETFFSFQTIQLVFLSMVAAALLCLTYIAGQSYVDWKAQQITRVQAQFEQKVDGHLQNIAPMVAMCLSRGSEWIWMGVDGAEVRGLCVRQKEQSYTPPEPPAPPPIDYSETL